MRVIYERALAIGQRFATILELIRTGRHSMRTLAVALNVSEPTISRCIAALRSRGYEIRANRKGQGWCFVLIHEPDGVSVAHQLGSESRGIEVEDEVG